MAHDESLLAAARAFLPGWAAWLPLLSIAFATAVAAVAAAVLFLWAGRGVRALPADAHWTERARGLAPLRRGFAVLTGGGLALWSSLLVASPLAAIPPWLAWALGLLLPFAATVAVAFAVENHLARRLAWRVRLRSLAAWAVVFLGGYVVAIGALAIGTAAGWGWPGTLAALGLIAALSFGGSVTLGRWLGLVRPAPEPVARAMAAAAATVGGAPAPVLVLGIASANAYALPLQGLVAVTEGTLGLLDEAELAAVFAHELGHLREPARVRLARAATQLALPSALVLLPSAWSVAGGTALLALLGLLLAWLVLFGGLSRRLEARADEAGVLAGPAYARALEALYRYNLAPAVTRGRSTHPNLHDRLLAAGVTPEWPRPAPPKGALGVVVPLAVIFAVLVTTNAGWRASLRHGDPDDPAALALLAVVGSDPSALALLAAWHDRRGDLRAAAALYGGSEALAPWAPGYALARALTLVRLSSCDAAAAALARVEGGPAPVDEEDVAAVRALVVACRPAP